MSDTDEYMLPQQAPSAKKTTTFSDDLYVFSEINHFSGIHQPPVKSEWDPEVWNSIQKHLSLMDLIALLCVAEPKHSCAAVSFKLLKRTTNGVDILFALNSPASKDTKDFVEKAKLCLNRLLQGMTSADDARMELSHLVFHHCRKKMLARYKKLVTGLSAISLAELINDFPNDGNIADSWGSSLKLSRDQVILALDQIRTGSLKLDEDSHFSTMLGCSIVGYTSGILDDDLSATYEAASRAIRKFGDYYHAIYRITKELLSINRRAGGITIDIREAISRKPVSVVLSGTDVLSIINRWAKDHRYDELTIEALEKAYPLVKRDVIVRPFLKSTELGNTGQAAASEAKNIKIHECAHAECSVVMERVKEVLEGLAKTKKRRFVIEVGVSKSVCWTCCQFFREVHRAFGIRVAYSRHLGKVYAGWAAPECPSLDTYSQVIDAVGRAVEGKVEEIVCNTHNKGKQDSSPLGSPFESTGFLGEKENSMFSWRYVQSWKRKLRCNC